MPGAVAGTRGNIRSGHFANGQKMRFADKNAATSANSLDSREQIKNIMLIDGNFVRNEAFSPSYPQRVNTAVRWK